MNRLITIFMIYFYLIISIWVSQEMTLKGGTNQACAACKYQRRKCTPECALAPYFPAELPKTFQNAHKLFGVSNILKILKQLDPSKKDEAMRSIIYQANVRDRYPVHGCKGVIHELSYHIEEAEAELREVYAKLAYYKQQQNHISSSIVPTDHHASQLELGMGLPSNNGLNLFHQDEQPNQYNTMPAALPVSYSYSDHNNNNNNCYVESKDNMMMNNTWVQQQQQLQPFSNGNDDSIVIQSRPLAIQQEVTHDYDEIHPFFDAIDDRQSYIVPKEAYESSSESSLKDTTQKLIDLTL